MQTSMMLTDKIPLRPNKTTIAKLERASDVSRMYYNLCVEVIQGNKEGVYDEFLKSKGRSKMYYNEYQDKYIFSLTEKDIKLIIDTYFKDRAFLKEVTNAMKTFITKDALKAMFTGRPKFKSKHKSRPSFPVRCDESSDGKRASRIYLKGTKLTIPNIGDILIASKYRHLDLDCKKQTARVIFDGKHWFLVFTYIVYTVDTPKDNNSLGLDVGLTNTVVTSEGDYHQKIDDTNPKIAILQKRLKKYSRFISRKYEANKQGNKFVKTKSIIRLEKKVRLIHRRIANIRRNTRREIVASIFKRYYTNHGCLPKAMVVEDLNIKGMMKNRYLAKSIASQGLHELITYLEYNCEYHNIKFLYADRFYPSSKLCSSCGQKKVNLKLKDRIYNCTSCNISLDRDYNASINLAKLGM